MKQRLLRWMQISVLLAAATLVVVASVDVFTTHSFASTSNGRRLQAIICVFLLLEMCLELYISSRRSRYVLTHWPFALICIPYGLIFLKYGIVLPSPWELVFQMLPIIRCVFVFGTLLKALRFSNIGSITGAYLALLAAILYFSSLIFYIAESGINPEVHSFRSAVYWAVMCMTTTGSNIQEMTDIGQVLASILPAAGLILFPVFTVYISSSIARYSKRGQS